MQTTEYQAKMADEMPNQMSRISLMDGNLDFEKANRIETKKAMIGNGPKTIVEAAVATPSLSRLVEVLKVSNLVGDTDKVLQKKSKEKMSAMEKQRIDQLCDVQDALNNPNTAITVFVPTNDIFEKYEKSPAFKDLTKDVSSIQDLLANHIVLGSVINPADVAKPGFFLVPSSRYKRFRRVQFTLEVYENMPGKAQVLVNHAIKVTGSVYGPNFAVHLIDNFILPFPSIRDFCESKKQK